MRYSAIKPLAVLLLPLFSLFAFAGCGGSETAAPGGGVQTDVPPAGGAETPAETASEGPALGLIISADELQSRLDEPGLRILDARPEADYQAGHVPGAVRVDADAWKSQALADGGLHDAHAWSKLAGELGIEAATPVVVYAVNPTDAARIWWTLKYVGVEQAAVLDGGWPHWEAAAAPMSAEAAEIEPAQFTPMFQPQRLAEIGDVKQSLGSEGWTVVDARSIEEFTGTGGPGARKGRIPGAKHIEWKDLLTDDGRFKSPDELRALFEQRGLDAQTTAVTHCQSGGRAALDALALELAGFEKVKNYYCGWQEWSADEEAPVEDGR